MIKLILLAPFHTAELKGSNECKMLVKIGCKMALQISVKGSGGISRLAFAMKDVKEEELGNLFRLIALTDSLHPCMGGR